MQDIMFNTAMPSITVPTMPITMPMLWKASGIAKKPPPMVAFTMCISASLLLCEDFGTSVEYREKNRYKIRFMYHNYIMSHYYLHFIFLHATEQKPIYGGALNHNILT